MAENNASGHKRRKPGSDDSPDKSYYVLNKSLDVCGKCNKKCSSKAEAIQCDMCCMWVHATCDNVTKEQYKAIKSLSPLRNSMYYCNINNCLDRFNSITSEWIKYQANNSTQLETVVTNLTQQYLSTEHVALQKAVSDLSSKIDNLQAQESKLSDQIKNTSDTFGKQPVALNYPTPDRKSHVVVFGVAENPPKTSVNTRMQNDLKALLQIFDSIDVHVSSGGILDCFRLGKFKPQQTRPRPILVKLQSIIDANAILANKAALSPPIFIKPDMSLAEHAKESLLLKERWKLIQAGYDCRQIKLSNNSLYVDHQLFGEIVDSEFCRSGNYQPHPPAHRQSTVTVSTAPMDQQPSANDHQQSS